MPRPGPRPYECVRRAWHSDRHQPIRGSIIQQIFRVVNERHSAITKKNREWQEKLPVVVLKAEEIMYSKANSELEYMSLETLWDRVNEAINIIIRRDESTETGELLPPCVEAALNLGCIPVRASRSQRHSNPRSYLSPRNQESASIPPKILDNTTNEQNQTPLPLHSANQASSERPKTMNFSHSRSECKQPVIMQNKRSDLTASCSFSSAYEKFPSPGNNQFISRESNTSMNLGRVYTLYPGTHFQPEVSQLGFQTQKNLNSIIIGTPVFPLVTEPAEMGFLKQLLPGKGDENALSRIAHPDSRETHEKASERTECDLSLRLGPFSDPCLSRGKGSACDIDMGQNNFQEMGELSDLNRAKHKEFSFFPVEAANDPLGFTSSSSRNFEGEFLHEEAAFRKRKLPFDNSVGDGQFFRQAEPTSNWSSGRMRRPATESQPQITASNTGQGE